MTVAWTTAWTSWSRRGSLKKVQRRWSCKGRTKKTTRVIIWPPPDCLRSGWTESACVVYEVETGRSWCWFAAALGCSCWATGRRNVCGSLDRSLRRRRNSQTEKSELFMTFSTFYHKQQPAGFNVRHQHKAALYNGEVSVFAFLFSPRNLACFGNGRW